MKHISEQAELLGVAEVDYLRYLILKDMRNE